MPMLLPIHRTLNIKISYKKQKQKPAKITVAYGQHAISQTSPRKLISSLFNLRTVLLRETFPQAARKYIISPGKGIMTKLSSMSRRENAGFAQKKKQFLPAGANLRFRPIKMDKFVRFC